MPSSIDLCLEPPENVDVDVLGCIPPALSGRLLGIDHDGVMHSVSFEAGQVAYCRSRRLDIDARLDRLLAFGGTILAFGAGEPAYELGDGLDTARVVDLAGHGRMLAPFPKHDPITGELHLVARADAGAHAHVVVSAGALTRRERTIPDAPAQITDLALSADHVVFVADGFVGIAAREGAARTSWIPTFVAAPHPVQAHDAGDTVVLLALTPSLERWTLHPGDGTVRRHVEHTRPHGTAGDFVFVHDTARSAHRDDGWLVGLRPGPSNTSTDLFVLDAADIAAPAVATVRIHRSIPHGFHITWIPETDH